MRRLNELLVYRVLYGAHAGVCKLQTEYDIGKFVNFVQINEADPQKMKLVTYHF